MTSTTIERAFALMKSEGQTDPVLTTAKKYVQYGSMVGFAKAEGLLMRYLPAEKPDGYVCDIRCPKKLAAFYLKMDREMTERRRLSA